MSALYPLPSSRKLTKSVYVDILKHVDYKILSYKYKRYTIRKLVKKVSAF